MSATVPTSVHGRCGVLRGHAWAAGWGYGWAPSANPVAVGLTVVTPSGDDGKVMPCIAAALELQPFPVQYCQPVPFSHAVPVSGNRAALWSSVVWAGSCAASA